jgi:hypothetical protein
MGFLRKRPAEVVRKGVGDQAVEEKTVRRVGRRTVEIRRVRQLEAAAEAPAKPPGTWRWSSPRRRRSASRCSSGARRTRRK